MLKKQIAAIVAVLACAGSAHAAYLPVGPVNDVSYNTVVNNWGWSLISSSNYGSNVSIADLFAGHGDYVMIGAMHKDSGVIDVLSGALYTDVTTYTTQNAVHVANGTEWYFNALSMGFAGLGDTVCQTTADTCGMSERDRLSWHTTTQANTWAQTDAVAPSYVFNGWRSGANVWIYDNTDWTRVVFTASDLADPASQVPEPASLGLVGLGLAALAMRRRKSR
ncbi:PEP-CTERM sorting domain-containing protein [Pseudoduganella eburnea]|uniref:PEP-CTERM sorting domain-containing protein n=1 Tax=Massilia eburnea TaxID=1776165 RepID=A0A6L6QCM6_9BURK|nr:PEP-CTERM sorting domain-containing protein [Massilia eburnea]MTW09557.1 PEP-CTERM sorting domain-containing protein [Massilia eburnea]